MKRIYSVNIVTFSDDNPYGFTHKYYKRAFASDEECFEFVERHVPDSSQKGYWEQIDINFWSLGYGLFHSNPKGVIEVRKGDNS